MDCKFVVGLILYTNKGKNELDVCDEMLKTRYTDRYISIKIDFGQATNPTFQSLPEIENIEALKIISDEWKEHRVFSGGLGLFIQAHGDATEIDVKINNSASAIKALYDLGLRFRKINIGWCFSGGNPAFRSADSSTGVALIKKLAESLGTEEESLQSPHKLHESIFCCYMAAITYKPYSGYQSKISGYDASVTAIPRNQLTRSGNLTHPHADAATLLVEHLNAKKPVTPTPHSLNNVISQIQGNKNLQESIKAAVDYVTKHKSAWKVIDGVVTRVGLDQYSDAEYIRHMHTTIVGLYSKTFINS
jgi:hypothetical protein